MPTVNIIQLKPTFTINSFHLVINGLTKISCLCLLDFFAAFDAISISIDHNILITH